MRIITIASISALSAVVIGALSDHMLKQSLDTDALSSIQTALEYQFIHSLALLFLGSVLLQRPWPYANVTAFFFTLGIICFCGGIYTYALLKNPIYAYIIPFGGMSFIIGWLSIILASLQFKIK